MFFCAIFFGMFLFCLLLFPLAFLYYAAPRFAVLKPRLLFSLGAFFAAGIICAFRGFFMYRSPYDGEKILYFLMENVFAYVAFPLLVYLLFLLVSKDDWRTKIESYVLFMIPFYAVYLPSEILANPVPLPFFFLFVKPVLYLVMVVAIGSEVRTLCNVISGKGLAVALSALIVLAELALPPLVETFWHFAFPAPLWAVLSAAYVVLCAFRTKLVFKIRAELSA